MTSARRILIDTDPGIDDAMAIFFALASPEFDVASMLAGAKGSEFTVVADGAVLALMAMNVNPTAYLPCALILFREFAVTIGVAILVSGFVSLTLTPMLRADGKTFGVPVTR